MLEMKNVSFSYKTKNKDKKKVLNNKTFFFEKGITYALFGESGVGKTTTLMLLGGLETPDEGMISIDGVDLVELGFQNVRRNKIAYVFQNYQLFPYMTAVENVLVAIRICERKLLKKHREKCIELLNKVGIVNEDMNRPVSKLSGGQQQRVAIVRAIINESDYILADEPTGNLDEENAVKIMDLLSELAHEYNKCVIVVTHSSMIREMCDIQLKLER